MIEYGQDGRPLNARSNFNVDYILPYCMCAFRYNTVSCRSVRYKK